MMRRIEPWLMMIILFIPAPLWRQQHKERRTAITARLWCAASKRDAATMKRGYSSLGSIDSLLMLHVIIACYKANMTRGCLLQ
jgi:hypothetical protein